MKVLVTGADGMLGQDLCPILEDFGHFVIETDCKTLDVTDKTAVEEFFAVHKPDLIIHCAAYTNVDGAEKEPEIASKINVSGTEIVAAAAEKIGAIVLYISTDYVFDGKKNAPYLPSDAPNPLNHYGLTKFQGETAVRTLCKKFYIVRTSWLYGHHGKNFVETMLSSVKSKEINVVDDQIGCPTWTCELANGIIKTLEKPFGVYHICGSGKISWYGFAKEIFAQSGLNVNLKACTSSDYKQTATRPSFSVMDNDKICRNWKTALRDYLALRNEEIL